MTCVINTLFNNTNFTSDELESRPTMFQSWKFSQFLEPPTRHTPTPAADPPRPVADSCDDSLSVPQDGEGRHDPL